VKLFHASSIELSLLSSKVTSTGDLLFAPNAVGSIKLTFPKEVKKENYHDFEYYDEILGKIREFYASKAQDDQRISVTSPIMVDLPLILFPREDI
jgi:hypothetical protein